MNPKLAAAKERWRLAQIEPEYQEFRDKSLAELFAALQLHGAAADGCVLRIHNTLRENGLRDAWWEVVPKVSAADNGDPPGGDESHPCPPLC